MLFKNDWKEYLWIEESEMFWLIFLNRRQKKIRGAREGGKTISVGLRAAFKKLTFRTQSLMRKQSWPGVNFTNVLRTAFTLIDPESVKRYCWLNCIFCALGIYERTSCTLNVDEIDPSWSMRMRYNLLLHTCLSTLKRRNYIFSIAVRLTYLYKLNMILVFAFCLEP